MIIFMLCTIPALLIFLACAGILTYFIRSAPVWVCALYFVICSACMLHDKFTLDIPVGQTVYAVIGISQDAY